jgi:transposase InsO family protein
MKYRFIKDNRSSWPVEKMCRALRVSRSGYYAWQKGRQSRRHADNLVLLERIQELHRASRGIYGSPRIFDDLREEGFQCGKNRVARLMRRNGIVSKVKRKFKVTTTSRHTLPVADNLVARQFSVAAPNRVWVSDITYLWTAEGWLYLTVILDLYSRSVVGWSMSDRLTTDLALKALGHALLRRRPAAGLLFHSDRGSQYASEEFRRMLRRHGIVQSMSRAGDCYDNAVAESFFHTLKTEHVYFERYQTRSEARQSIFDYIEVFYNRQRRHSALGSVSPVAFEAAAMAA